MSDWKKSTINGGSLKHVHLETGSNGWASPPGNLFNLRDKNYFTKKTKSPSSTSYLLHPAGVDWLKSASKLDHVLSRADNRIIHALRNQNNKTFVLAVNLQVPGRDQHSAVFYFATDDVIPTNSLLYRFINGDDSFRNSRFKMVNRIVKGPWLVRTAVGGYSACLLGKALNCHYYRGDNYLEIDVDIGSSKIATAILHLALGCVNSVTIDMGFVVEAVEEEELPERLLGAVRICQMEMSSATVVSASGTNKVVIPGGVSSSRVANDGDDDK
ncbi:enhanced disease resistance 2-like protein [Tanacetum coccineum]